MSSLFNLKLPTHEKPVFHHPWERIIKDEFTSKVKYAHNSVKNPRYPREEDLKTKPKPKVPKESRIRFTIIGNRVTKEFVYCVSIAKGLYKYRQKIFDSPIIRGVTSVEWPSVWNDLKLRYGELAFCINSQVAVIMNDTFLGGEEELKEFIESRYVYHLCLDYYKEGIGQFATYIRSSGRPCAYFHISIDDEEVGSMIFMLYSDILPYTCDNFLRLCKQTKGGYGGTPVHRIVKDGWIQCGGFGLKSNDDLGCENFIVPHDRRGVLCMANDGRNVDCSTQFFVLLQPAPWMAHKYVAFGQLIDGESTLQKIEQVPTLYESPTKNITIYRAGILNMDCQDIMINKNTKEFIFGHIDDLYVIGEIFYEELLQKVFDEIERREHQVLTGEEIEGEVTGEGDLIKDSQRFIRNKEDIEKQLGKSQGAMPETNPELGEAEEYQYAYEYEGSPYRHVSLGPTASLVVKPEKPYYLPLTDVPYPGEVDSNFDLKRFLRGDYCHEIDLEVKRESKKTAVAYPSELFVCSESSDDSPSSVELDSEEEREIKKYLSQNVDHVSFAGGTVKKISKRFAKLNILGSPNAMSESFIVTDEILRKVRTLSPVANQRHAKKVSVSINADDEEKVHHKIKRRQTGFVRPTDLEKIRLVAKLNQNLDDETYEDNDANRKVRISQKAPESQIHEKERQRQIARRPTGFVRMAPLDVDDSEIDVHRPSVLQRLYDDVAIEDDDDVPTLKDYKTKSELIPKKSNLLTTENLLMANDESKERYFRPSMLPKVASPEQVLNLQHGKKVARKISSDYVNTIDQIEHRQQNSIRSVEYAKMRPTISVTDYQTKNSKYQEEQRNSKPQMKNILEDDSVTVGLRLPGDTPLYLENSSENVKFFGQFYFIFIALFNTSHFLSRTIRTQIYCTI
ncbi:uncharacterized protein LOC106140803 [Amyelois transitella]|uniref:uncharacterized protein LOC106140803 n=1 Tax=Amyelois transitella TaxID=680683 RepID=UPI00298FD8CE|nr:uncharacterized protein LOC106140803 [Amyelois transitella]